MMFTSPCPSQRSILIATILSLFSTAPALANSPSGWPDCDTTCLVTSYALQDDTVACLDELAAYACASLTLVDTCTLAQTLAFHVIGSGADSVTTCEATTALGDGPDGAIRLTGIAASGLAASDEFIETEVGLTFTQYANDVAILTGEVAAAGNPDQRFEVFIVYENRVDGSDWTGGFKHWNGCTPPTDTWDIYTMKNDQSHLLGRGAFEGSLLQLQHAPSSQFFGFQVGEGANDHNCAYGAGGWFAWEGTICGAPAAGALGDVIVDLDCSTGFDPCTAQSIAYFNAYVPDCGVLQYSIDILRVDDEAPVISGVPDDINVVCLPELPEPDGVTATDNCPVPGFPTLTYEGVSQIETADGDCRTFAQTWRAEDECGNVTTASRLIHQFEDQPPVMVGLEVVMIECDEWPGGFEPSFEALVDAGIIDVADNCTIDTVLIEYGVMSGGCYYDHILTYTPIDECGNIGDSFMQIVVVDDQTPPTLVDVPADTIISCTSPPDAVDELPHAIDNCDGAVNMTFEVNYLDDGDGCDETYIIERIFIAEDCGYNHARDTQLVHVVDTAGPVLTLNVPGDTTLYGCFSDVDVTSGTLGDATYTITDDCGEYTYTLDVADSEVDYLCTGSEAGSGAFERTWTLTATDCAGNTSILESSQSVHVIDTTAPVLTVEPIVSLDCADWAEGLTVEEALSLGFLTVSDNCGLDTVWVELVGEVSNGCAGAVTVRYVANDDCLNSSEATQIILLVDTVAPVFIQLPADSALSCDGNPNPYVEGAAVAVDACSNEVTITTSDELVIDGCASTAVWERTITATDFCGNATTHVQLFPRQDLTPPTLTAVPADTTVACTLPAFDPTSVSATDDCDATVDISTVDDTVLYVCTGTFTVERTITAADCAGNEATHIQTISVQDTVAPELTTSGNLIDIDCAVWSCDVDLLEELGHVSASDNCGDLTLTANCLEVSGGCFLSGGRYTVDYTATDACGNSSTATQIVTLIDTVAPVASITCPADVQLVLGTDCTYDLGAPDAAAPWGAPTGSATDQCDDVLDLEYSHSDAAPTYACEGDGGNRTILRTHTLVATDDCGNANTVSCVQTIELIDETGPVVTLDPPMPQNLFECLADTDTSLVGLGALTATAEDACGGAVDVVITYSDVVTQTCAGDDSDPEGNATLDRTFTVTATDCMGNSTVATHTQTVNFFDVTDPSIVLECPADTTLEADADCNVDLDPTLIGEPGITTFDNCDTDVAYTVAHSDVETAGDCLGKRTIVRTFTVTATDDCGHETVAMCDQTINVVDVTAPTLAVTCPDALEVTLDADCSWSGASGQPLVIASDGCDPSPDVTVTSADHDTTMLCTGDDAVLEGSLSFTRTFTITATDDCGNTASTSCDQLITLLDEAAPVNHELETLPTDTLYLDEDCLADLTPGTEPTSSAEDGCDSDVAITVTHTDDPAVYAALSDGVTLEIDTLSISEVPGATTYRIYAVLNNLGDCLSAVVGEGFDATWITSTEPFFQHPLGGITPENIDPVLFGLYPDLEQDSWVTIGIDGPPIAQLNQAGVQIVESSPWVAGFEAGGSVALNSNFGDGWFSLPTSSNGTPGFDGRVLLAQLTTAGHLSGQLYLQVLEGGPGGPDQRYTLTFGNACTDEDGLQEGSYTFTRTWQSEAVDDCGNTSSVATFQNIAVLDTIAPQFTHTCGLTNGEELTLPCAGENILDFDPLPAPCETEAADQCDTEVGIARFDDLHPDAPTDGVCNVCAPTDPAPFNGPLTCDGEAPESMRLYNFNGADQAAFTLVSTEVSRFAVGCDSSIAVTLHLEDGAGGGFLFEADYFGGWDWDTWNGDHPYVGIDGAYKKDCAAVYPGVPVWLDWNYFIMSSGMLTGTGTFAGSSFALNHQPLSGYFGFQVGPGANNKNEEYGASGWFFWQGELVVDGTSLGNAMSSGDIFVDLDCCLPWTVEHDYVAQDDCGNATTFEYTVTNTGETAPEGAGISGGQHQDGPVVIGGGLADKQTFNIMGLMPNPTSDLAQLQFEVFETQRVTVRLHAMTGEFLMELFDGVTSPGNAYQVNVGVSNLASGLYQLRVSGAAQSEVRKLLVSE